MHRNLETAIKFLLKSGNIKAISYFDIDCQLEANHINTIFPAAFKLHSLAFVNKFLRDKKIETQILKLTRIIEKEEREFTYNYFLRKDKPKLPDDLDDSSLAYSALSLAKENFKPEYFLKIMELEVKVGGPYRTWFYDNKKWDEVDPIVNAHFYYFSTLCEVKLPKLKKYLVQSLNKTRSLSKYYPSNLFLHLYLSKSYYYSKDKKLKANILNSLEQYKTLKLKWWEKFLINLSRRYLSENISEKYIDELLELQKKDGSLALFPLTIDYPVDNKKTYTTSKEFTTSLLVEFLILYTQQNKSETDSERYFKDVMLQIKSDSKNDKLLKIIFKKAKNKPTTKPILLPYLLLKDLKANKKLTLKEIKTIQQISISGFYGWTAFTMLDDYVDHKDFSLNPILISNSLRWQYKYLSQLNNKINWSNFLITESQYLNEFENYSLKDFNKKTFSSNYITKRMHAFTSILSEVPSIFKIKIIKQSEVYQVLSALMIIDQLNDDLRDWRDDKKNDILTYVTFLAKKHNIRTENKFFNFLSPIVFKQIDKHLKIAEKIIEKYKLNNIKFLLEKSYSPILKVKKDVSNLKRINKIL